MVLCRFIFLLIFIPIAIGLIEAVSQAESSNNSSSSVIPKNLLQKEVNNTKKILNLPVEGGNIVVPQTNLSLLKENDAVHLPKLPTEDFEETSSSSKNKGKHVVGRTGAPVIVELTDISTETPVAVKKSTIMDKLISTTMSPAKPQKPISETMPPTKPQKPLSEVVPPTTKPHKPVSEPVTSTARPHKPSVLRYEENLGADGTPSLGTLGISVGASTTPANKPGSHPGMIMPVVITILTVPLFAVLGYMALKRGQEAWKNRHYKRMDFLLDGMYND